ncbi:protein LAX PANICLE 2-like [Oryza brachyantha]|uniref:protein LAX PANICLE 2-like n=1 Tax=Oryza brachyantha TaxID=4533 RepID=UPI001ADB9496|nr:protein LAX PANICLE 2-like [Oryza brachyantha]
MVPARRLHLVVDAPHGHAARCDVGVTAPPPEPDARFMAQEPINQQQQHHDPPKPPQEQPQQERIQDDHRREPTPTQPQRLQLQLGAGDHHQQEAGTSGSSSGGSTSNGVGGGGGNGARDWLRLSLAPASPAASGSGSDIDLFTSTSDHRATTTTPLPLRHHHHDMLVLPGMPPGPPFLRPAMPGIPQASIPPHMPRAAPPWLPPWGPVAGAASAAAPPHPLLPFAHRAFYAAPPSNSASAFDTIRVVLPPSAVAAAAGVWFVLQAAPHQGREPFLPQIPRSYLRIKDGRVTVRLLTKYLVNKLGLEDESEVEITCRGRQLLPILTLQHVRDSIWCQRDAVSPSFVPDVSTADHIMVLQYGRRP